MRVIPKRDERGRFIKSTDPKSVDPIYKYKKSELIEMIKKGRVHLGEIEDSMKLDKKLLIKYKHKLIVYVTLSVVLLIANFMH